MLKQGKEHKSCKVKICKKQKYELNIAVPSYIYGIAVVKDNGSSYLPVYPFSSPKDVEQLKLFVEEYGEELVEFYAQGHNTCFSRYIYGFNTGARERFKEEWYKRGIVID